MSKRSHWRREFGLNRGAIAAQAWGLSEMAGSTKGQAEFE